MTERYSAKGLIELLAPWVEPARLERVDQVVGARLSGVTMVVENLHYPHNGAAALRSAEAMGLLEFHAVETKEPFHFSDRITQGCEKWLEIRRHPTFRDCADALQGRGFRLYAAAVDGALEVSDIDPAEPVALVFGNERDGVSDEALALCDSSFRIPMYGFSQSLNLSVSAAISLFAVTTRLRRALGAVSNLEPEHAERLRARYLALSSNRANAELLIERYLGETGVVGRGRPEEEE